MNEKFRLIKSYSSVVILHTPATTDAISDCQLVWMAKTAFLEAVEAYLATGADAELAPGAMVLLAPPASKKIYIASSIRFQTGASLYKEKPVKSFLDECTHRTGGKCGEFNVLEAYYEDNPNCNPAGSRIVAWVRPSDTQDLKYGINAPPCSGNDEAVGCSAFTSKFGLIAVSKLEPSAEPTDWVYTSCNSRNFVEMRDTPSPQEQS